MATNDLRSSRRDNRVDLDESKNEKVIQLTESQLKGVVAAAVESAIKAAPNSTQVIQHTPIEMDRPKRIRLEEDFNNRYRDNEHLAVIISREEKVDYRIPQIYEQYVNSVTVAINGQSIKIPADGVTRRIPKRFVPIIEQYLANVDAKVSAMNAVNSVGQYGGVAELDGGSL